MHECVEKYNFLKLYYSAQTSQVVMLNRSAH